MQFKWIATAALGVALAPGVVLAQSKTSTDTTKGSSASQSTTTTASTGDVSTSTSNVTPAMIKAQDDPNLIGSPAWWKTHATADGKPLSSKTETGKSEKGKP